jgi:hypothetical protein
LLYLAHVLSVISNSVVKFGAIRTNEIHNYIVMNAVNIDISKGNISFEAKITIQ